jgi:hypothetical protein
VNYVNILSFYDFIIVTEPIQCENMISFNLAVERGIVLKSITVNGSLKIRTQKKIFIYQFSRDGEWPVIDCLDQSLFNENSHLIHFHQLSQIIQIKFYEDDPEDVMIKLKNGEFKTQISIKDNFNTFKKRMISNFYIKKDIIIGNYFENKDNSYNTVMPVNNELWLHVQIRNNLIKTTIIQIAEVKNAIISVKTQNGRFSLISPYLIGWNVNSVKYNINMLSGVNDKEVTIKLNKFIAILMKQ